MNRRYLYLIAGLIWGIPGIMLTVKGAKAYTAMPRQQLWWLALITAGVLAGFIAMFLRIVKRYCALIAAQPQKTSVLHTFPLRGWILVIGMSCLGMALKFVPIIPAQFTAGFYSGLGPALVVAAILFIKTGLEPEQARRI
ncbi:MAG: hypothetical protein IJ718_06720 [Paludibacteraceae bacterium]|nr:hypothetical protein [Paludibacteraceae bacterium]